MQRRHPELSEGSCILKFFGHFSTDQSHHVLRNTTKHENRTAAAAHNNAFSAHRPLFSYKFFLIDHVKHKRRPGTTLSHDR